jgi:hypothetical protein
MVVAAGVGWLDNRTGGVLVGGGLGSIGALIWRGDAIPWRDIASWTVPLAVLIAVAWWWVRFPLVYIVGEGLAVAWLASFIFWLRPVGWWYRRILRKPVPR